MPATAAGLGVKDPFNPEQNINGMARHLRYLNKKFDGDPVLVAAAYNAGEVPVERLGRIPRYKETMAYVRRVFANYYTLTDEKVAYEQRMPPPLKPRKR
jgi:soluble lytic murein transglycosylase-like protein